MSVPLDFHVRHAPRREIADAEIRQLRKAVRQVERAEGLDLGSDDPDPRPKLQALGSRHHQHALAALRALTDEARAAP